MKSFKLLVATMLLQMLSITNLSAETVEVNIDMTAVVGTDVTSWNAGSLCSTQYAPEVTTADGRTAQMAESYEMTVETIDTLLFQIVTDLNNGTYTVVLYANALYTSGRGFESSLEEGATDVAYVFANGKSVPVTAGIGTETSTNGEYTLSDVKVTDGTLTMGLAKSKAGTNWHTIQIKSLILNNADFLLSYGQNTQQPWEAKCFYHEATDGSVTPGDNWYATDFDDSAWDNILGPISNSDNYYHATDWDSSAFTYWVRRHFTLESIPSNQNISLQVIHDDGCQIYLNGNLIYNNEGYLTSTSTITLTSEQKAYLREGDNVIAATVNNSGGSEAFIDFGMEVPTISEVGGIRYKGTIAYELTDRSLNEYVVKEGTTTINDNLFNDCNATSITLPNSLKTIENWAFHNCHNLKTINIPQNVKKIEYGAFYNCHALDSITYNAINCTSASNDIFYNCSNLKTIIIGDNVESIPANIFRDNDNLQKVTIGSNVKSIGDGAFYSCDNLKDINIPNSVEFIGNQVFYYCNSLPIENGIRYADCYALEVTDKNQSQYTLKENTRFLGSDLFSYCYNMTSVNIPEGITAIGDNTFVDCNALTSITLPNGVKHIGNRAFCSCDILSSVTLGTSATTIGSEAFRDCPLLQSLTLPDGVTSIGSNAFYGCSSLQSVNIPSGVKSIGRETFEGCQSLNTLALPDSLESIGERAFYNCNSLQSVNIPSGVKSIGSNTFYGCYSLTSLELPEGVTSIGSYAFYDCKSLRSVNIPSGVKSIEYETFYNCNSLKSLVLPDDATFNGSRIFYNCTSLQSINIPSGVKEIQWETFYGCQTLSSLTLPDGLTSIGSQAFYNCKMLESITIPSGVKTIGSDAFSYCESLKSVTLPDGLTSIEGSTFQCCRSLQSINIPSGVKSIGGHAFYECESLKSITLPDGLTTINDYAFPYCRSLKSIKFPKNLVTIGEYAFGGCSSLDSVAFSDNLVAISRRAFESCYQITYFEFPSSLKSIGESNLNNSNMTIVSRATTPPTIADGCSNKLMYVPEGSGAAYRELYPDNIIIDGEGTELAVAVSEAGTFGEEALKLANSLSGINKLTISGKINNNDMEIIRNNMPDLIAIDMSNVDMEVIPYQFLYGKSNIMKLVLPNNTKEIGTEAFFGCNRMKEVVLPTSLTTIGYRAFYNSGITSIVLPENVTSIGSHAFNTCSYLESINIPAGITRIEESTFSGCRSLKSIVLPASVTYIGNYAFDGCSSLETIKLPEGLTEISQYSFTNCSLLKEIEIPSNVTTISSYAFSGCSSLESITMGGKMKTIREYAFNYCNKLKSITCQALFPPTTSGSIVPNTTCVLYAPEWTLTKYKLAANWGSFAQIEPISSGDIYPNDIFILSEESLDIPETGLPQDYKPNLTLEGQNYMNGVGRLTVKGNMPLTLSTFEMSHILQFGALSALLNKGAMSADNVVTKLNMEPGRWYFLSFPYDVKVSDIVYEGGWVIRYYDGEARAQGDYDNAWKNVPYDGVLEAGMGYIWHSESGNFEVPAMNNDNKNKIFSSETQFVQLEENISSLASDNGWNLIGNPYPCYFDTRYMSFTSPITVCTDGYNYDAHSPVDDSYILSPLEAFFVQCSAGNSLIDFLEEGRQINASVRTMSAPSRVRGMNSNRSVYNLYLKSEDYTDRTRFVVNEEASCNYEIACDAAKFMSEDPMTAQLFTIEQNERMAINERPMGNGEIALGIHIGKAGSYTLSLDARTMDNEVVLIDRFTGKEIDILASEYTFTTEAGTFTDRFSIRMKAGVVDEIDNVSNAAVKVASAKGAINVYNATSPVQIYNAAGALVASQSGETVTVEVTPGVYVIKIGTEAYKVSVVD